jgi:ribosomal protein S18 acetylase RimI-like enzyme
LSTWTIRSATEQDIPSVLDLWIAADSQPTVSDTPQGLSRLHAVDPDALLIADLQGSVIGSIIAVWDGWRGSFYRLAVHPEHRRQGIATALLHTGEHRLGQLGAERLTAIVADDFVGAGHFWAANGYQRQEHRTRFVRLTDRPL